MKRLFTLALVASATVLSSCIKEQDLMPIEGNTPITVEVENPQTFPMETKSSYTEADLNRISDLNILVYHNGTLLPRCSRYFNPAKNISIDLPSDKDGFNIYMLGNVGNITKKVPTSEADMVNFQHIIGSYNDFRTNGFPVANKFENFTKGTPTRFKVKRLVGQYNFTITTKSPKAEYTIKAVKMKNCALDIYPFMDPNKPIKAQKFADKTLDNPGDYLSAEDIAKLNAGQPVDLYFLENLQGTLLPGNTDPKKKGPNGENKFQIQEYCTFLEIVSDVKTPAASYIDGKYRYFLGADATTNFDVHRARKYNLNISMSADMVTEEGWRVEVEAPTVIGRFEFDKTEAKVMKGVMDAVFINPVSGNHADLEYTVKYVTEAYVKQPNGLIQHVTSTLPESSIMYTLKDEVVKGVTKKGIFITSNIDNPDGGAKPQIAGKVILMVESVDKYNNQNIIREYITVDVYKGLWPITFKRNPQNGQAYVHMENPWNLDVVIGVKDGNQEKLIVISDYEWQDTEGNWVTPVCQSPTSPTLVPGLLEAYRTSMPNHSAGFKTPNWSRYICIDARRDVKELNLIFYPLINGTLARQWTTMCTDGKAHTLKAGVKPYSPYPRIYGSGGVTGNALIKEQLGKGWMPETIPAMPDGTWVEMKRNGYTLPTGSYTVDYGTVQGINHNISDYYLEMGGKKYYPFKYAGGFKYELEPDPRAQFCIRNGIANINKINIHNDDPTSKGENNATLRGFYVELYGPGRDLDEKPAGVHYAQYFTRNIMQFAGIFNTQIYRYHLVNDYQYKGTYMTVNGSTVWPLGSIQPNGTSGPNALFE